MRKCQLCPLNMCETQKLVINSLSADLLNNPMTFQLNTFCTAQPGPHSLRLCSHHLQKEDLFSRTLLSLSWKTWPNWNWFQNFLPMKGENSITAYCVVLTFKLEKVPWLVKEILVFWSTGYVLFTAGIKLTTWTINGCLILNKLGRRRVKLCQRIMATLQY